MSNQVPAAHVELARLILQFMIDQNRRRAAEQQPQQAESAKPKTEVTKC